MAFRDATDWDRLLGRLEELVEELDGLDEGARAHVLELLDGVDAIHRLALTRLGEAVGEAEVSRLRGEHPAIRWLFDTYGVGVDQREAAESALASVRPYVQSHGGEVTVLDVEAGVVRLRMSGACSGCTASAVTLQEGVETALREGMPGFVGIEVEEDDAAPHPPPGPTLLQIESRPS